MLEPNVRSTYTNIFRPPAGLIFDQAVAATFSLDLTTLLTVPLHLVLFSSHDSKELLKDPVALLEALRRTSAKLAVYCQQAQIRVPKQQHVLYGMLERMLVEVKAPRKGVFHPKFWVIRFVDPRGEQRPTLRLAILSRNLTSDRSWDISLVLDGEPRRKPRLNNKELADLVARLPKLAVHKAPKHLKKQAALLADELLHAKWKLPEGFQRFWFHTLGLRKRAWKHPQSERLAVISPFCTDDALKQLADSSEDPAILVSRTEELARLKESTLQLFSKVFALDEAASVRDAEDGDPEPETLRGLHAKAYISKRAKGVHQVLVGSANATSAALLASKNVEILAELNTTRLKSDEIDQMMEDGGLIDVLVPFERPPEADQPDPEELEAERCLEAARAGLAAANVKLSCEAHEEAWCLSLSAPGPIPLEGIRAIRTWPVTLRENQAIDASSLQQGECLRFPPCGTASLTGLLAFELTAMACDRSDRFVLNLPIEGLPEDRDKAVVRSIVRNREGFLRYLLLLLAETNAESGVSAILGSLSGEGIPRKARTMIDRLPLLEEMTRTLSRDPDRLRTVKSLVEDLLSTPQGKEMMPEEFLELWEVFEEALTGEKQ